MRLRLLILPALVLAMLAVRAPVAEAAWPTPIASGPESAYAEFNGGDLRTADNLLRDVWPARSPRKPVALGWPLTWTEDPYKDAYWRFYFYALRPTSHLLWAYATTKDQRYHGRLLAILRSYAAHDADRSYDRLTFDNPHAAAYRAMVLVNTVVKLDRWGVLPPALRTDLVASIRRLGTFLEQPRNYEHTHNHGFNQALALTLIGRNFPAFPEAARWRSLGVQRLLEMLRNTIDADGVEVENSPFYHLYVLGMVAEISTWAKKHEPAVAAPYASAAQRMLRYAAYVTQPDGSLPMLGATATTNVPAQDPAVYGPLRGIEPAFDWVFTRGAAGSPPAPGTALFPVSGLFVMRSPTASANQTFLTFDAGIYRTDHSHLDALSVTMFSSGAEVLPEAGLFTYDKGPDHDYFHGTRGHNTVMVDGLDQPEGAAVPGPYGRSWASGTSRLYTGVTHKRTVALLGQDFVVVLDGLSSTGTHDYSQLWHLPPGAAVKSVDAGVLVSDAKGQPSLSIVQASPARLSLRRYEGSTDPIQGWHSRAYGFKVPAPTLEYRLRAQGARLATVLASGPHAPRLARVTQQATADGRRVAVCATGVRRTIVVRHEGTPRQTVAIREGCTLG